jgi:hypothetical protein
MDAEPAEERCLAGVLGHSPASASMQRSVWRSPIAVSSERLDSGDQGRWHGWRSRMIALAAAAALAGAVTGGYLALRDSRPNATVESPTPTPGVPGNPPAREYAAMAYDPSTRDAVMFGGFGGADIEATGGQALDDTWLWNGASWSEATPAHHPSPRAGAVIAWDPKSHRIILLGGVGDSCNLISSAPFGGGGGPENPGAGCAQLTDAWAWNGIDWTSLGVVELGQSIDALGVPSGSGPSMATDPATGEVVLVSSAGLTWTFNGRSFDLVASASSDGPPPYPRLIWAPSLDRLIAVSTEFPPPLSEVWIWSGSGWTPTPAATQPSFDGPWIYDDAIAPCAADLADDDDVYVEDNGMTWTTAEPSAGWTESGSSPAPSQSSLVGPAMAYDAATQEVVLFGGYVEIAQPQASFAPAVVAMSAATWSWAGQAWSQSAGPSVSPVTVGG